MEHAGLYDVTGLTDRHDITIKVTGNTPIGWGALGIREVAPAAPPSPYGVLLCTHGKVVKSELFGQSTGLLGNALFGIVEIPRLVEFLTTNKSDLRASQGHGQELNRILGAVASELRDFLARHGITVAEPKRSPLSAKLERELTKIVRQLPELRDFDGLLRKSQTLRKSDDGDVLTSPAKSRTESGAGSTSTRNGAGDTSNGNTGNSRAEDANSQTRAKRQRSRRNQGPRVAFEDQPDRHETAWLASDTIVVNEGHPAYQRQISQDQARLTYCMFAIGVALDKADIAPPEDGGSYVDRFITVWGQS